MIRNLKYTKLLNHKINPNLIGFSNFTTFNNFSASQFGNYPNINYPNIKLEKPKYNYQTYRYNQTNSKTIFTTNNNQNKLISNEQECSSKISSDVEFDLRIRNIVQEELKKNNTNLNNIDTKTSSESNKNILNDVELENKIKIREYIGNDSINQTNSSDQSNLSDQSNPSDQSNQNNTNKINLIINLIFENLCILSASIFIGFGLAGIILILVSLPRPLGIIIALVLFFYWI